MNREIKFRVFDTEAKSMSDSFYLFGEFTLLGAVHDWQMEIRGIDTVFENGDGPNLIEMLRELVVMQYTGLKDKNGNEIYEGDLLIIDGEVTEVKAPSVFEVDAFKVYGYEFCSGFFTDKYDVPTLERFESYKPEVIGNIYEGIYTAYSSDKISTSDSLDRIE